MVDNGVGLTDPLIDERGASDPPGDPYWQRRVAEIKKRVMEDTGVTSERADDIMKQELGLFWDLAYPPKRSFAEKFCDGLSKIHGWLRC